MDRSRALLPARSSLVQLGPARSSWVQRAVEARWIRLAGAGWSWVALEAAGTSVPRPSPGYDTFASESASSGSVSWSFRVRSLVGYACVVIHNDWSKASAGRLRGWVRDCWESRIQVPHQHGDVCRRHDVVVSGVVVRWPGPNMRKSVDSGNAL